MRNLKSLAVAGLIAAGAACGTKEAAAPLEPTGPTGRVRFVNMITDTTRGRVNAILEGVPFGVNLTYGQSTPASLPAPSTANYSPIYAGSRTMLLRRTADTTALIATIGFTVTAGQDQTIYATGGAGGSAITPLTVQDDNPAIASSATRLRFVNVSPTAGGIDIFVTAPNADLSTATPTFTNVGYRGASTYATPAVGTYQIRIVPTGTTPASRAGAVIANIASLSLAGGAGRTVLIGDRNLGGAPVTMLVLTDQ
jgi:hypothetical protein